MSAHDSIHFRILEDIARELSGDVNFPTCMDAALLVRNTLKDPFANLDKVVQVVGVEPLISSKLLRLANSVSYNPSGKVISDLATAIGRIGFDSVRTISLAVAMDQMLKSRNLASYESIAHNAWSHSIHVAAIARVLARRLGRINPDDAMMAGLVHDIGVFYLLYRATEYPEYRNNREATLELLIGWHEGIGESLLHALGIPERITEAVRDHDRLLNVETPCTVRDVLYFANLLAGGDRDWMLRGEEDPATRELREADRARYLDLVAEAEDDIGDLRFALGIRD
ncbi:HDOD domain-containing protein [Azonexus fungiphilus]|uniref:HDOD domain-containing protein n=1 Tax=Azonexus fungiphilus TaxID=146940 RepID=UPI00156B6583|nr:HDOD domain-containing protein [Azonexus fungiphilus]NHC08048.1 HDOD domain-containing protein [Azonexus fungiphilus]